MQDSRWVARRRVAHARIRAEAGPSDRSLTARDGRRRGRSRSWRDPGLRGRALGDLVRSWRGTRGAPRGSSVRPGQIFRAGWPSTSWPLGIPSDVVVTGVASVAPALATGRERRRAPPRPSSLANASRMCDAGDVSPTTRAVAQGRRLRSPSSGARRRHRGSCRSVAIGPTDALARRRVLPDR